MSNDNVLYIKGMNRDYVSDNESDEDIWDDGKLNQAYDKAVSIANAEIAKRIAMSTNSKHSHSKPAYKETKKSKFTANAPPNSIWKAGMACRAVYEYDGLEYEAFVLRIINDKECVIRFLGFENSEIVPIESLLPSHGKEVREKQIKDALLENEGEPSQMECASDQAPSENSTYVKKTKSKKKKSKSNSNTNTELPTDIPFPTNMSSFMNQFGPIEYPIPPPPVTLLQSDGPSSEDQALSSMLLSWYMSGYCTGYYQGIKKAKSSRHNKHH